jgi:hypothetical protein
MYPTVSREELVKIYDVSQGYLGYLLREKRIPLPVRINGEILWYKDEVDVSLPKIKSFLERRKQINYNATAVLPMLQLKVTAQASGVLAASALAGATECYVTTSGATALTTDTAVNIIAQLVSAIQTAAPILQPVPVISGVPWTVYIRNTNAGTLTLTAGTGVTITGTATIATTVERQYLITITSPTTVTFQDLGGATVT